jgi:PilZ domain-containing protein
VIDLRGLLRSWQRRSAGDIPDSTNQPRGDPRVTHYFECRWFGKWGAFDARLNDLSVSGCYIVNRRTTPSIGEIVEIDVVRTAKEPLPLSGEVVSTEPGIGFGVRFAGVDDNLRKQLETLMAEGDSSNRRAGQS